MKVVEVPKTQLFTTARQSRNQRLDGASLLDKMSWFCENAKCWEEQKRHERVNRETGGRDCGSVQWL